MTNHNIPFLRRKRIIYKLASGLFTILIFTMSGCAQRIPEIKPVNISFVVPRDETTYFGNLVQNYKQIVPETTIKVVPMPRDNNLDLRTLNSDCLEIPMYIYWGAQSNDANIFLSLDSFIDAEENFNIEEFYPGSLEPVRSGGKIWAIPAGMDPTVMYYNKDLFDSAGANLPQVGWTWDNFLSAAVMISGQGSDVWGYSPVSVMDAIMFIYQHGGKIVDDMEAPSRTTFDDPLTLEAMEWYARLFQEFHVAPMTNLEMGSSGTYMEGVYRSVFAGKIGMWTGSFQERGGIAYGNNKWPFHWGMAPLPRDAQQATFSEVEMYVISSKTSHPEACWKWIAYLSNQVTGDFRLVPARKRLVESKVYEQAVGKDFAATARASLEHSISLPSEERFQAFLAVFQAFNSAVEKIQAGQLTVPEAMEQVQTVALP